MLNRLYEPAAYAPDPGSYWAVDAPAPDWPRLEAPIDTDIAVIGGGFTGLNAALALAEAGAEVSVFEAERPGWGASGRNGGFCCLGGGLLSEAQVQRQYGHAEADAWKAAQVAAVAHVERLLSDHGIAADVHSRGEVELAHSARAWRRMQADAPGPQVRLIPPGDLAAEGLGGPWYGGREVAVGFALHPQKYHGGLARAAQAAGARLYAASPVTALRAGPRWELTVAGHRVTARRVILATNGYSGEDLPPWLRGRTLPVQSSVLVTRKLTAAERAAAGWTSGQMAYDSRQLLHYFRLLPEGRFLFGMRGGLTAHPREQARVARRIRRDFARAFPAWAEVEITHVWSGLVCLLATGHPFVGPVPGADGLFAGLGYHGNGVAMGSYAGRLLADLVLARATAGPCPAFLSRPPGRFPLGRHRRLLLRPAYLAADMLDL